MRRSASSRPRHPGGSRNPDRESATKPRRVPESPPPVRSTWKGSVLTRVERIRTELALVTPWRPGSSPEADPVVARILFLVSRAEGLATRTSWLRNLIAWLTGSEIEQAWAALHEAGRRISWRLSADGSVLMTPGERPTSLLSLVCGRKRWAARRRVRRRSRRRIVRRCGRFAATSTGSPTTRTGGCAASAMSRSL
jgi:hypothetical protein